MIFISVAAFGVQQFVEVIADPICTALIRVWIAKRQAWGVMRYIALYGFSELEARTIANGLTSSVAGVVIASCCLQHGVLSVLNGASYSSLDKLLTGLIIGA